MGYIGNSPALNESVDTAQLKSPLTGDLAIGGDLSVTGSGLNTPSFFVTLASAQSINHDTWTKLGFDTVAWDTDSAFASNKFTVPADEGGKYLFCASILYEHIDDAEVGQLVLYKNGAWTNWAYSNKYSPLTAGQSTPVLVTILSLSATDYMELYTYHNEGSANTAHNDYTFFAGYKLAGV